MPISQIDLDSQSFSLGGARTTVTKKNASLFAFILDKVSEKNEADLNLSDLEIEDLFQTVLQSLPLNQGEPIQQQLIHLNDSDSEMYFDVNVSLLPIIQIFNQMAALPNQETAQVSDEIPGSQSLINSLAYLLDKSSKHMDEYDSLHQEIKPFQKNNRPFSLFNVLEILINRMQKAELQSLRSFQPQDGSLIRENVIQSFPRSTNEGNGRFIGQHLIPFQQGMMDHIQLLEWHSQFRSTTNTPPLSQQVEKMLATTRMQFRNGITELTVRLQPEHLGSLTIKLIHNQGEVTARMITQTDIARHLLESQIHQLRLAFHAQNLNVEKIEVVHMESSHAETEKQGETKQDTHQNKEQMEKQQHKFPQDDAGEEDQSFQIWLHALTTERGG